MEKILIKCTIFVIVALTTFTKCKSKTFNVIEGDVAQLDFTYLCNSTVVTLQLGSAAPFYSSANPNPPSLSSNLKLRNETNGKICFLHLTIDPVSRADQGGYILTAYKSDPTLFQDERILLLVEYPPGKASCELSGDYIEEDWVRVYCTAPLGNVNGQIACYQNGIKMPPLSPPEENDETLSQSVLAKLGDYVYCCSSIWHQTKDRCDCKDSVWDPIQNKQVMNVTDPCPTPLPTLPIKYPTFSQHPIEDNEIESTSTGAKTQVTSSQQLISNKLLYGLIVADGILFLYFVISIVRIIYFKRSSKKPANLGKIENGTQESFIPMKETL